MKDTFCTTKKRVIKEAELTIVDGVILYQDADMTQAEPLNDAYKPFLGETCTITIVNKEESDDINSDVVEDEE